MTRPHPASRFVFAALILQLGACAADAPGSSDADLGARERGAPELGPVDGRDLPAVDTGRVAVGDLAPDFALESYAGPVVRLSEFRGAKNVILVFYRGHW